MGPRSVGLRSALALAGLVAMMVAVAPASASRPATPAQAEFIIRAVTTSKFTNKIPVRDYSVRRIRISSINRAYASAALVATPRARNKVQSVVLLLKQTRGTWRLIDLDAISCGLAPRKVLNELFGGCIPS